MKLTMHSLLSTIALSVALLAAGAARADSAALAQNEVRLPLVGMPTDGSMKGKLDDRAFVDKVSTSTLQDLELSKIVLQKSKNAKVKEFAQQLADAAQPTLGALRKAAAAHSIEVPRQLGAEQRAMIEQTQEIAAADFDETYVRLMQKSQDMIVGLYDNAAGLEELKPELRQFALTQLPSKREMQKKAHGLIQNSPASGGDISKSKR